MGLTTLRYDVQDHVATIAMDRPEARNALSDELLDDLLAAFAQVRSDDDVRVVVAGGRERGQQVAEEIVRERIARRGLIHRDRRDAVGDLVAERLEVHARPEPNRSA